MRLHICVFDIENAPPESKIKVLSLNQNSYNGSFTDAVSKSIESIPFDEFSDSNNCDFDKENDRKNDDDNSDSEK